MKYKIIYYWLKMDSRLVIHHIFGSYGMFYRINDDYVRFFDDYAYLPSVYGGIKIVWNEEEIRNKILNRV